MRAALVAGSVALACLAAAGCATTRASRPAAPAAGAAVTASPWSVRAAELQQLESWKLAGRAAAAVGTQGWQATLDWRQARGEATVHLAGPLGVGAVLIQQTARGLSVNGAPPSAAALEQLQQRLGFELPLNNLRYWLLGVPDPNSGLPADTTPNAQDRLQGLSQAGWTVTYDRYMPVDGDVLPAKMSFERSGVRVRIAVEQWQAPRISMAPMAPAAAGAP